MAKKSPAQLDREVAEILGTRGLGRDPQKRPAIYMPTYCNRGHRMKDGKPVGHECKIIPPAALEAERAGHFDEALAIMGNASPMRKHRGVKEGSAPRQHSFPPKKEGAKAPPSYKQIAEDYKRIAKSAKAAGGKVTRTPDGSILIVPTEGSDEYFYQDWQADELIEETKRREKEVLEHISIEDLLLAQSQHW